MAGPDCNCRPHFHHGFKSEEDTWSEAMKRVFIFALLHTVFSLSYFLLSYSFSYTQDLQHRFSVHFHGCKASIKVQLRTLSSEEAL